MILQALLSLILITLQVNTAKSKDQTCTVEYKGNTLGKCESDVPCVGSPKDCQVCKDVIQCQDNGQDYSLTSSSHMLRQGHVDFHAVKKDLKDMMTQSEDFWPADFGHYGPFFIRLAWHSAGTYRTFDGQGGSNGGRIRFEPEESWPDNSNLDKALRLLEPIKEKYGKPLSWADLIILAGDSAIESMGGETLGFCGGRTDDDDGADSMILGPTKLQEKLTPCKVNGQCKRPLGPSTVGLIYVNAEGPMGVPDPKASAYDIREVFGRMGMNDTETVALIGGGHTTGKCHGICKAGNVGSFSCRSGKGEATFTSGFELIFTSKPISWDNEYFRNLHDLDWKKKKGPSDLTQWEPKMKNGQPPQAPKAFGNGTETIGKLTTDYALKVDPAYKRIVKSFKDDMNTFNHAWKHVWYKLTTADMGPRSRCINADAPPAQPFQHPLPDPPANPPKYERVKKQISKLLDGNPEALGKLTRLAWQCASTFRSTDFRGGCNGARVRFPPQKHWPGNENLDQALLLLKSVREEFETLSWSDLIILAGNTAIEKAGGRKLKFCGGRADATDGKGSQYLYPRIVGDARESFHHIKYFISVMGLKKKEFAALLGIGYAIGDSTNCSGLFCCRNSFYGSNPTSKSLSNILFRDLLSNTWKKYSVLRQGKKIKLFMKLYKTMCKKRVYMKKYKKLCKILWNKLYMKVYKAEGKKMLMLHTDYMFYKDKEMRAIAQDFADNNQLFLDEAAKAWTKLTNADRFDGPTHNLCNKY